jgi:acetylornithine deacetylase/succinyl-diaminopimelate desuccinylase-like protein
MVAGAHQGLLGERKAKMNEVLDKIRREGLVDLVLELCNIPSSYGLEKEAAEFIYNWMKNAGFEPRYVAMVEDRPNVVGCLRGRGRGLNLIFNSHLDTAYGIEDELQLINPKDAIYHHAWRAGEEIYGEGVVNDKGPMAAFLLAAKAIKESGVVLAGDLWLTAAVGEISKEPVDEYQGTAYLSKDLGTRFLLTHGGVMGDYALVAEGTDFTPVWVEAGKAFFKVSLRYSEKPIYTPYLERTGDLRTARNAIVRLAPFIEQFEEWAVRYEERNRFEFDGGVVVPRASINAVRGGLPYHMGATSQICNAYIDVRLAPGQNPSGIRDELRALLSTAGLDGDVELYLYRRGFEAESAETLRGALTQAHTQVFGAAPKGGYPGLSSMWRDINVFNEMGIPAMTYGPPRAMMKTGYGIDDLLQAARVYALTALEICKQVRSP